MVIHRRRSTPHPNPRNKCVSHTLPVSYSSSHGLIWSFYTFKKNKALVPTRSAHTYWHTKRVSIFQDVCILSQIRITPCCPQEKEWEKDPIPLFGLLVKGKLPSVSLYNFGIGKDETQVLQRPVFACFTWRRFRCFSPCARGVLGLGDEVEDDILVSSERCDV